MTRVVFHDVGEISTREETPEGFLSVVADFARSGVQEYYAGELPYDVLPAHFRDNPKQIVRMLRPEIEVFSDAAMRSFAGKPVTNEHPPKFVDKSNFRQVVVGTSKHQVSRNEDKLRVGLVLQAEDVIEEVKKGKDQLSAGYSSQVVWGEGDDPVYGAYDAKQTEIRGNHIAVVNQARGGPEVRINDSWPKQKATEQPKEGQSMATREIKGIAIEFSDQGAQAVDQLVADVQTTSDKVAALEAQLSDSAKEVERLKGELDAQKAAQLTDDQIENRVTERLEVYDKARKLYPEIETRGKSATEIKREAIEHADSDKLFDLNGKSAEYIDGVFATLVARAPDTSRESMRQATQHAGQFSDEQQDIVGDAQRAFRERNANAWKYEGGAA